MISTNAWALQGITQNGYGTIQRSLAGAGLANPEDASALALNPAGLVDVGSQLNISGEAFMPSDGFNAVGTQFIAPGAGASRATLFVLPSAFYSRQIDADSAVGIGFYANEGAGTTYRVFNSNTNSPGVFGDGTTGVQYLQAVITMGYAHRFGNVSVGVAPLIGLQRFNAWGLAPFESASVRPGNVTNHGYNYGVGGGISVGAEWKVIPTFRVAVAGSTPIYSTDFSKYSGLLADSGQINGNANVAVGFAWDIASKLTVLFDYKHVFQSAAVANQSEIPPLLGSNGGPGFHFNDLNIETIAAEWHALPSLTFRAGYSHNNEPLNTQGNDLVLGLLAPVTFKDHFSVGVSYNLNESSSFGAAFSVAPREAVTGNVPENFGGGKLTLSARYYDATVGYSYKF